MFQNVTCMLNLYVLHFILKHIPCTLIPATGIEKLVKYEEGFIRKNIAIINLQEYITYNSKSISKIKQTYGYNPFKEL
jgi:hypothetical protein